MATYEFSSNLLRYAREQEARLGLVREASRQYNGQVRNPDDKPISMTRPQWWALCERDYENIAVMDGWPELPG